MPLNFRSSAPAMKNILCFTLLYALLLPGTASALIHRCIQRDGSVSYQDVHCALTHTDNKTLPIEYQKTNRHAVQKEQVIRQRKKHQHAETIKRQQRRKAQREKKAQLKAEKRTRWYAERCESAKKKKAALHDRLRRGYSAKTGERIKEQLQRIEERERKYCESSRHH